MTNTRPQSRWFGFRIQQIVICSPTVRGSFASILPVLTLGAKTGSLDPEQDPLKQHPQPHPRSSPFFNGVAVEYSCSCSIFLFPGGASARPRGLGTRRFPQVL